MDFSADQLEERDVKTPAKFSFLERLLHHEKSKNPHGSLSLRPLKDSRVSQRGQHCEQSVKDIIKRSIFKDSQPRVIDRNNDNLLMKGRMLNGVKKPIENQMANLLKNINDRIVKEMERSEERQRNVDLPLIARGEHNKDDHPCTPSKKHIDIFRNLKEVRSKRTVEQIHRITKSRNISELCASDQANTINSQCVQVTKKTAPTSTASDRRSPRFQVVDSKKDKEVQLKKGYLAYDQAGKAFLDTYRGNMVQKYKTYLEKSRQLTAKAYIVVDSRSLTLIAGKLIEQSIEIASISKVMTCYLALLVCRKYSIDIYNHTVRISEKAAETPGTTAELQPGDILTVYQLLLGLMLPSGNDASVALAESMGKVIQRHKTRQTKKSYYQTFISHMNLLSRQMNLEQSWGNSSGLSLNPNYSTPEAITLLSAVAMKHELFAQIVNTRKYDLQVKNDRYGLTRSVSWKNTNKLLQAGWQGVKTGTTENAGHCLMAKKDYFLIAVFNCQTLARRFHECVYLHQKYQNHQQST